MSTIVVVHVHDHDHVHVQTLVEPLVAPSMSRAASRLENSTDTPNVAFMLTNKSEVRGCLSVS